MTDLLTGSPFKRIAAFCVPLLIGNLFQQMYSMADSVVVSTFMGKEAFAAVTSTGAINFLVIGFVLGLCSGFSIPIAQDYGAGDTAGVRRAIGSCVWLGVMMTVVLTAAMFFFTDDLLRLLNTPQELFDYAYEYIFVIFMGMAATMLYNMLASILRALGDSRTPLYYLILSCLINIALDILFIAVFHLGVAGAAYATLAAQLVSGVLCLRTIRRRFPQMMPKREDMRFDPEYARRLFVSGVPMGLQFSITAVGSVVLQGAVNGLGVDAVAAMGAGGRVSGFVTCPLDSLGIAAATFTGQNIGAKNLARVRQGVRQMMVMGLCYCAFAFLLCLFGGRFLTSLFVSAKETNVLDLTQQYLTTYSMFYPALLIIYVFRNTIQGLGYSKEAMLAGLFELFGRCGVAFGLIGTYGFAAAAFASPVAWIAADLLLLTLYYNKMSRLWRWELARQRFEKMKAAIPAKS